MKRFLFSLFFLTAFLVWNVHAEELLLSSAEAVRLLSLAPPMPTNSTMIAVVAPGDISALAKTAKENDDLARALILTGVPEEKQKELLAAYQVFKTNVAAFVSSMEEYSYRRYWALYGLYDTPTRPQLIPVQLPEELPEEFLLFAQGVELFCNNHLPEARAKWETLLSLPANHRAFRTDWAKALMAESFLESEPEKTILELEKLREELKKSGNKNVELAVHMLRAEAFACRSVTNYVGALNCLFALNLLGQKDLDIMRHAANQILQSDDAALEKALQDPDCAAFLVWHAATQYSNTRLKTLDEVDKKAASRLLLLAEKKGLLKNFADCATLAAYRAGDFNLAREAAAQAPTDSFIAPWMLAKIKLAEGKRENAKNDLASLYCGYNLPEEAKKVLGTELALLYLSAGHYRDSLDVLLQIRNWRLAAYVAEKILSVDELRLFLKSTENTKAFDAVQLEKLSYLLARRFVREGKFLSAKPYFPASCQGAIGQLLASLSLSENAELTKKERGAARADAARTFYYGGVPLCAAENEPDFFCAEGDCRSQSQLREQAGDLVTVSEDEGKRVLEHSPKLSAKDFCYENAVSQAWLAIELLPNDSEELATLLCEAGRWTENRDTKTAGRFFKLLLERCPATDLGREAASRHWFPSD